MKPEDLIELYQPSNGTEGDIFMSQFCYKCVKFPHSSDAKNQCFIFLMGWSCSITDKEYPKQLRYIDDKPVCTAFKDRELANMERRSKRKKHVLIDTISDDFFA